MCIRDRACRLPTSATATSSSTTQGAPGGTVGCHCDRRRAPPPAAPSHRSATLSFRSLRRRCYTRSWTRPRPELGSGVLERVMRELNRRTDVGVRWSIDGLRRLLMIKLQHKYHQGPWSPSVTAPPTPTVRNLSSPLRQLLTRFG